MVLSGQLANSRLNAVLQDLSTMTYSTDSVVAYVGNKFDYSLVDYTTTLNIVKIICPVHGEFNQVAANHLSGKGCKECGRYKKRKRDFKISLKSCNEMHSNYYKYDGPSYSNVRKNFVIICPIHGRFEQRVDHHLRGSGCTLCKKYTNGFSRSAFIKYCKEGLGILYVIRCKSVSETFIKVGITSKEIKERFNSNMPYEIEVIENLRMNSEIIYDLEKSIHRVFKKYKYTPLKDFSGKSECFLENIIEDIKMKEIFEAFRAINGKLNQEEVESINNLIKIIEKNGEKRMSLSTVGLELLKTFEGYKNKAYKDSANIWTIGYGTIRYPNGTKVKEGDTCTEAQASTYMLNDLKGFEETINNNVKVVLTQNQYDSLVSLCYNIGSSAFKESTLLKKLNAKDYLEAADQFLRWNKAGGKVISGLKNRREKERELFLK